MSEKRRTFWLSAGIQFKDDKIDIGGAGSALDVKIAKRVFRGLKCPLIGIYPFCLHFPLLSYIIIYYHDKQTITHTGADSAIRP